jgi:hypothetical protein
VNVAPKPQSGSARRRSVVAAVVGIVAVAALAIVVLLLNRGGSAPGTPGAQATTQQPPAAVSDSAVPTATTAPGGTPKPPSGCANCQLSGDNVVYQVGGTGAKSVRPGTYSGGGPVTDGGLCLWTISSDPEGKRIISQKSVEGPGDLLLRAGTYFRSEGCKPWVWKSA